MDGRIRKRCQLSILVIWQTTVRIVTSVLKGFTKPFSFQLVFKRCRSQRRVVELYLQLDSELRSFDKVRVLQYWGNLWNDCLSVMWQPCVSVSVRHTARCCAHLRTAIATCRLLECVGHSWQLWPAYKAAFTPDTCSRIQVFGTSNSHHYLFIIIIVLK